MYSGTSHAIIQGHLEVAILDGSSTAPRVPLWRRRADNQLFVAGADGAQFSIYVRNLLAYEPLLVVPSIDHRAILEDKPASPDGVGFILHPGSEYVFDGWRKNDQVTLPFIFTVPDNSVAGQAAAREHQPATTGVIGFAIFRRRQPVTFHPATYDSYEGNLRGGYSGQMSKGVGASASLTRSVGGQHTNSVGAERFSADLGTGVGSTEQHSPIHHAEFERLASSRMVAKLLYASAESLDRQGILVPPEPEPFPVPAEFTSYRPV